MRLVTVVVGLVLAAPAMAQVSDEKMIQQLQRGEDYIFGARPKPPLTSASDAEIRAEAVRRGLMQDDPTEKPRCRYTGTVGTDPIFSCD